MKHIPFFSIFLITSLSLYILIYGAQAIAQEKKQEENSGPILIKLSEPRFDDLEQKGDVIKVQTVIDGKTFVDYNSDTYMLAGLDIQLDQGEFSFKAKELLEDLIKDKTLILFHTKNPKIGRQNRMGHYVVHALDETNHSWVQASLIANGMARVRTTTFTPEQADILLAHEEDARRNKRGLWAHKAYQIHSQDTVIDHIGGFHIVEGIIKKVSYTKNNIYLNFGDSWKTDFTVGIAPTIRKTLSKQGISPLDWANKKIRVRGWIRSYNGPYIELNHAEQIEILEDKDDEPEEE